MPNTRLPAGTLLEITDIPAKDGEPHIDTDGCPFNIDGESDPAFSGDRLIRIIRPEDRKATLPADNDAAFERLTEAVKDAVESMSDNVMPVSSRHLRDAFTAYASSRREAKLESKRELTDEMVEAVRGVLNPGNTWAECENLLKTAFASILNPPAPAPTKTLGDSFRDRRRQLPSRPATEVEDLLLSTGEAICDAIDSLRAEVKAGNGGKT